MLHAKEDHVRGRPIERWGTELVGVDNLSVGIRSHRAGDRTLWTPCERRVDNRYGRCTIVQTKYRGDWKKVENHPV